MSDKYSDILTTDYANINSRKYQQRHQNKRNSEGAEKNKTSYPDLVLVGRQTKITGRDIKGISELPLVQLIFYHIKSVIFEVV